MKKFITLLFTLFVISFALRAVFLIFVTGVDTPLDGDAPDYHGMAVSILNGDGWRAGGALSYRPPFVGSMLALVYAVFGTNPIVGRWSMVFVSSLVAPLLFALVYRFWERRLRYALAIALAWVIYPPAIFFSSHILTETSEVFLILAVVGTFLLTAASHKQREAIFLGILFALTTLNRPVFILLPFTILFVQLLLKNHPIPTLSKKQWLLCLGAFFLTMAPWTIRNWRIHHVFMPTTSMMGRVLVYANTNLAHPDIQAGKYIKDGPTLDYLYSHPEGQWNAVGLRLAQEQIRQHPWLFIKAAFNRGKNFWTFRPDPYDPAFTRNDLIMLAIWLPTLLFFVISFFVWSWKHDWIAHVIIAYLFIFTLPFWGTPRFRFPVDALIITRAIIGLVMLFPWLQHIPAAAKK